MNPLSLCLSIVPLNGVSTPPAPVTAIVQSHVISELREEHAVLAVNFGAATCPHVIHYEHGLATLTISGEAGVWRGKKQIAYTDALAGRPIDFSANLIETDYDLKNIAALPPATPRSPSWQRWLLWTGVGVVVAGVAYRIYDAKQDGPRPLPNGSASLQRGVSF